MRFEDVMGMSAASALKIFGDQKNARRALGRLVREWHPDVCADPRARDALSHLTRLRATIASGGAPKISTSQLAFTRADGTSFGIRPLSRFSDGVTDLIVGQRSVSRIFSADDADLARAAELNIASFRFADDAMRKQMSRFLPERPRITELADGRVMHTHARRRDQIMLSDLLRKHGPFDARTGAWIVSGLMNIACWLGWAGVRHGAISPEMVLVSPEFHETALIGGWEFSGPLMDRPAALPEATVKLFPALTAPGSVPPEDLDLSLIREVAMTLFGVPDISRLLVKDPDSPVPPDVASWIAFPQDKVAFKDYETWKTCLRSSFGEPKFVDMGVLPEEVYAEAA